MNRKDSEVSTSESFLLCSILLNMKYLLHIILFLLIGITTISCKPIPTVNKAIELAAVTENSVEVKITLEREDNNQFLLSAIFTPLDSSLHLYSKEVPRNGVDGLGRPALLELSNTSTIKANGDLIESTPSEIPLFEPFDLLVYPAGPIKLSLPILLPDGKSWVDDQVIITYMACNDQGCRPPVEGKAIAIQVPGNDLIQQ
jgi:hypothetical protein